MSFCYNGIDEKMVTLPYGTGIAGQPVGISEGETQAAALDKAFFGVLQTVRGKAAGVQFGGYVELPFSGVQDPQAPWCRLTADGNGGVRFSTAADIPMYRVISIDSEKKTVRFML